MKSRTWIISLALTVSLIAYNVCPFIPMYEYRGVERDAVMIGQAVFIFLIATFILIHFKHKYVSVILFGCAVNNVLDELFFNPYEFQVNEYAIGVIILVGAIAHYKCKEFDEITKI